MSRCLAYSAFKRPVSFAASSSVTRGSRWSVSTKGGGGELPVKMPRLTHRMRRLARAHPEAVAAVSPSAVQDSRSMLAAEVGSSLEIDQCSASGDVWLFLYGCQKRICPLALRACLCHLLLLCTLEITVVSSYNRL